MEHNESSVNREVHSTNSFPKYLETRHSMDLCIKAHFNLFIYNFWIFMLIFFLSASHWFFFHTLILNVFDWVVTFLEEKARYQVCMHKLINLSFGDLGVYMTCYSYQLSSSGSPTAKRFMISNHRISESWTMVQETTVLPAVSYCNRTGKNLGL